MLGSVGDFNIPVVLCVIISESKYPTSLQYPTKIS